MKKHTKGAIAAGVATVLLLGGAGTLAYWNDSAAIGGTEIASGELSLSDMNTTGWVYAQGHPNAGEAVNQITPGDAIAQQFTFTINAEGDNLAANLSAPATVEAEITSGTTPETLQLPVSATYTIDGLEAPSTITNVDAEDIDGKVVIATVEVDFPFGDADTVNANDTQNLIASLSDLTVELTQVNPSA